MDLRLQTPLLVYAGVALAAFALLLSGAPTASANSPWRVTNLHLRETVIYGVSCTSGLCVGAGTGATPPEGLGSAGVIVSSRHPLGGASAWKVALFPRNPRLTPQFRDVSCPNSHLCVAVANKGTVFTSRRPMGGRSAWKLTRLPAGSLRNVSCPSPRFCTIAGNRGKFFTSTDPTGGAGAWRRVQLEAGFAPVGISCASKALCAAVGGYSIFASGNPLGGGPWSTTSDFEATTLPWKGVACPSRSLCLVGAESGVYVSQDPATAGTWALAPLSSAETSTTAVACASAEACLAATELGYVFSSSAPADPSAWRRSRLPLAFDSSPFAISCAGTSLCVITGRKGLLATSETAFRGETSSLRTWGPIRRANGAGSSAGEHVY
jgi:hypothetical protein